jgi:hypothetical protein
MLFNWSAYLLALALLARFLKENARLMRDPTDFSSKQIHKFCCRSQGWTKYDKLLFVFELNKADS